MSTPPRIWLSNRSPKKGEVVIVRAMVQHPMETGLRKRASGELIPRKIIHKFEATLNGKPVLTWDLETGVATNPYLEFRFKAEEAGDLRMVWTDDDKNSVQAVEKIVLG